MSRAACEPEGSACELYWVAGVDGCRGGWLVILYAIAEHAKLPVRVLSHFCTEFKLVLDLPQRPIAIAVDMPIGLLEQAVPGGRDCDREARALLGRPRASSVFSPPARPALRARSYSEVAGLNGAGLSKESFNILPKIREIDAVLSATDQRRVFEVHPELVFAQLAGAPLAHSKKTIAGRRERSRLLRTVYGGMLPNHARVRLAHGLRHVALDDVFDACVLAHGAWRIRCGKARRVPRGEPPRDARGLRMEIWY
jgi:predicted RNase H-like nuclease